MSALRTHLSRVFLLFLLAAPASRAAAAEPPPHPHPGGKPPRVHALTGARIIAEPGKTIENGTLVIRDGVVVAAGARVNIPADARIWDLKGKTIYAGLIEPYLRIEPKKKEKEGETGGQETPAPATTKLDTGAGHPNPRVHPERSVAEELKLEEELLEEMRGAGFTAALVVPREGIFRGTSALVNLRRGSANEQVVRADVAQHLAFEHGTWGDDSYPNSLMGTIAVIRQTLLDGQHYQAAKAAYARRPSGEERPETNRALESLAPILAGAQPAVIEVEDIQMALRAHGLVREFKTRAWIVSGGSDEYKRLPEVKASHLPLVLAINFPEPPAWENDDEAVDVELETLRHWELAPANPARLHDSGVRFSVTTQGLSKRGDWRERVRKAIERGLTADAALAALTVEPAALLDVSEQLGTLAPGKIANMTITDGDLFAEKTNILEVWVDGERYEPDPKLAREKEVAGIWTFELARMDGGAASVRVRIDWRSGALAAALLEGTSSDTTSVPLAAPEFRRGRLELALPGQLVGIPGKDIRLEGEITFNERFTGEWYGPEDRKGRASGWKEKSDEKAGKQEAATTEGDEKAGAGKAGAEKAGAGKPEPSIAAAAEPFPPLPEPAAPAVLVRNATIWTSGPEGTLSGADLLVRGGKVAAVGRGLTAPRGAQIIDAAGKHVTPGLIDCHSHSAISGGVNEGSMSATSQVRIGDVIDAQSIQIYRQLAGGLTISNELHGSANTIGGQNAVIKLKWGEAASGLLFAAAPPGIKFALGENVKQSNWGDSYTTRYPQTRMGVEQWMRDRFLAARDYLRKRDEWRRNEKGAPPRRDLQLEALAEILRGERMIHCHSYRQDEILMLIRLADELDFQVAVFQHILEGYKVANEMAAHGAGGSSFSDWWAYKFEVYDAIPHNGAIMWDRGVVVSFNSDSSELARRLNTEAAKAVKYGGVPEAEALKFVTLNPAIQLGVADRVGSLAPGKDGDFVIWSSHPLSNLAHCEQTWIEGRRYFDRERDLALRAAADKQRLELLARARTERANRDDRAKGGERWRPTFGVLYGESEDVAGLDLDQGACEAAPHAFRLLPQATGEEN